MMPSSLRRGGAPCVVAHAVLLAMALAIPSGAHGAPRDSNVADDASSVEKNVRRQRSGAGLRVPAWQVREPDGFACSGAADTALYEGWFAKGLDLHMALENTVGFYRRSLETSTDRVDSYIVPLFTALKFYPWTRPENRLEPFFEGGAGFSIGVEDRETTTSSLLGGTTTRNTESTVLGYGFKVGPGLDWRFGRGLGLGLTYRFQYE